MRQRIAIALAGFAVYLLGAWAALEWHTARYLTTLGYDPATAAWTSVRDLSLGWALPFAMLGSLYYVAVIGQAGDNSRVSRSSFLALQVVTLGATAVACALVGMFGFLVTPPVAIMTYLALLVRWGRSQRPAV